MGQTRARPDAARGRDWRNPVFRAIVPPAGYKGGAMPRALRDALVLGVTVAGLAGCEYAGLLRPSVLSQLALPIRRAAVAGPSAV